MLGVRVRRRRSRMGRMRRGSDDRRAFRIIQHRIETRLRLTPRQVGQRRLLGPQSIRGNRPPLERVQETSTGHAAHLRSPPRRRSRMLGAQRVRGIRPPERDQKTRLDRLRPLAKNHRGRPRLLGRLRLLRQQFLEGRKSREIHPPSGRVLRSSARGRVLLRPAFQTPHQRGKQHHLLGAQRARRIRPTAGRIQAANRGPQARLRPAGHAGQR